MHPHQLPRFLRAFGPVLALAIAGAMVVAFAGDRPGRDQDRSNDRVQNSDAGVQFRNDTRKLWEDHVTWTRLVIISFADDLADRDQSVQRLLENQTDIGDAVKPYYGEAAGNQLTALLNDHIIIAAEILTAAKAGDTDSLEAATSRWYANGNDIAAFLNSANPDAWPLAHMQDMMREHLDLTFEEAVARLTADYDADVVAYDKVHDAILEMADMLSLGIIEQFPKRFK
jgi:hypothetical protein